MRRYIRNITDAKRVLSGIVTLTLLAPVPVPAQSAGAQGLNIEIVEGEGAINNIRLRTARETIVEVQDENHKPVSGALVLFSVKGGNPFSRTVLRATTDATGRVRANPLQLNSNNGRFTIQVKASYQGRTATQAIHQTNSLQGGPEANSVSPGTVAGVPAVASHGLAAAGILIIAGVAVGGAVGGLVGAGVIGGGGGGAKTTQISIGLPHF